MLYILGSKINSYDLISFDHQASSDQSLFQEGRSLKGDGIFLSYEIESGANLTKIKKIPYIESSGPSLVSAALREALKEEENKGEVEFFEASIDCQGESVKGFFVINPLNKTKCTDMEKSEYSLSNFDPGNPQYSFDYQVLKDHFENDLNISICNEMPREIVISDAIFKRMQALKIKGLLLYSALDMTMENRSVCVRL